MLAVVGELHGALRPTVATVLRETVAETANGLNELVAPERLEQLAETANVDVHGSMTGLDVLGPGAAQELVAAEHPPLVLQEEGHQPKLRGRELDELSIHRQAVHGLVEYERTGRQLVRARRRRLAAQAGVYAGDELRFGERHRKAIVRPELERIDGVVDLGLGRPDDHPAEPGHVLAAQPRQGVANRLQRSPRQHNQVGAGHLHQTPGRAELVGFVDGVPRGRQCVARRIPKGLFTVNDEDCATHGPPEGRVQHACFAVALRWYYANVTQPSGDGCPRVRRKPGSTLGETVTHVTEMSCDKRILRDFQRKRIAALL